MKKRSLLDVNEHFERDFNAARSAKSRFATVPKQRWVIFFSQEAYEREIKTLNKRIKKAHETQEKAWWHLSKRVFACKADALKAVKQQSKSLIYHTVEAKVVEVKQHGGRGRPKAGQEGKLVGYKIAYRLHRAEDVIAKRKASKGRFILATNLLDESRLSNEALLKEYKAQSGTEKSFKFIKNNTFKVDSVFLKTPERIEALMMVMTLCLMVYGISEYELHQSLAQKGETIPNQVKKQTHRPSLQWVYYLFRVVTEVHTQVGGKVKQFVVNVNDTLKQILRHFGERAQYVYLNSS